MARNNNNKEIENEIRRIQGQLLVAKQICRENLKEINHLKKQQENDYILQETNRLLLNKTLESHEHVDQFNKLLRSIDEEQKRQTRIIDKTIQQENNDKTNSLLIDLTSNITELESLFDYAKNLFTQPITSINILNNTTSLEEITEDHTIKNQDSIELHDLQNRIDIMHKKLTNIDQCDDCLIQ